MNRASLPASPIGPTSPETRSYSRRVLIALALGSALGLALLTLWAQAHVFLLVFAGILLATFLRGLSEPLCRTLPVSRTGALVIVLLLLLATSVAGLWLLVPQVAEQFQRLISQLPQSLQRLEDVLRAFPWGQKLLEILPRPTAMLPQTGDVLRQTLKFFSGTFGLIVDVVVLLAVGLYFAFDPETYRRGLLRLFPLERRPRLQAVLDEAGEALRWWLIGRAIAMVLISVLTWVALVALDIPMALALAVLAGVLNFVPYLGPILSFVPAGLVAGAEGVSALLAVCVLYLAIQVLESYIFTPVIQQRAVSLPPAVTIVAQVLLGLLLGGLGILLATPMAAVLLVLIQRLYVEDVLGDRIEGN